jgi:hypothetical protein
MQCCPNCFDDKWLRAKTAELSHEKGDCPLCEAENVSLIEASELGGYFHNLLSMYEVADSFESGERLIALIQEEWQVFDEDALNEDQRAELLEEIVNADRKWLKGRRLLRLSLRHPVFHISRSMEPKIWAGKEQRIG